MSRLTNEPTLRSLAAGMSFTATLCCAGPLSADVRTSFDDPGSDTPCRISYDGTGLSGEVGGALRLIDGDAPETGAVVFADADGCLHWRIQAQWDMRLGQGGHGMGFVLLDAGAHDRQPESLKATAWEEPSFSRSFGIGFDTFNPPGGTPFDADGNIYDRPQREMSLHVDGVEIANVVSPVEFATGTWITVNFEIVFITGGANVTVRFGDLEVYDDYFVPHLAPFESRVAIGARSDENAAARVDIDNVVVQYLEPAARPTAPPIQVVAYDRELITSHQQQAPGEADFSAIPGDFRGRVIATLELARPAGGFDPWDRRGSLSIFNDEHERFEMFRFITPFRRGGVWHIDVSHLLPIMRGRRRMELRIDTVENGWEASVHFSFYPGEVPLIPLEVINLWQGEPVIGDPDNPVSEFYDQRQVRIDPRTDAAFLRTTVTGHGQHPNTGNAAEYLPIERTITVRDTSFTDRLWTTDNYLNPVRPQDGTWKYDRAGWGPGTIVRPWTLDISRFVERGREATFDYELAPYLNEDRGRANPPTHWTETQLVLYRLAERPPEQATCVWTADEITIDGILSEDAWQNAALLTIESDIRGREHARPRYQTSVRLLWDDQNLYVAASLRDPHVNGELIERDAIIYFDNDFEIFLDPGRDGIDYFEVEINALNTIFDLFIHRPYLDAGQADLEWNWDGMESAVFAHGTLNDPTDIDEGWTIEVALPWKALRDKAGTSIPPRSGDEWGLNFSRVQWVYDVVQGKYVKNESRPEENWVWNPIGTVNIHHPGHWGVLRFD